MFSIPIIENVNPMRTIIVKLITWYLLSMIHTDENSFYLILLLTSVAHKLRENISIIV